MQHVEEVVITKNGDSEQEDSDGFSANEFFVICDDNNSYQYFHHDDLDEYVSNERKRIYRYLKNQCMTLGRDDFSLIRNSESLWLVQCYDSDTPKLKLTVSVRSDFSVVVAVQDRILPANHNLWESVPRTCANVKTLEKILTSVANFKVCIGNPDKILQTLIPFGSYLDTNSGANYKGYHDGYLDSTIRSAKCRG